MTDLEAIIAKGIPERSAEAIERARRLGIDARRSALCRSGARLTHTERELLIQDHASTIDETVALIETRAWLNRATDRHAPGPSVLVLAGPEGTGKTFAASWAIAREGGGAGGGIYRDVGQFVYAYRRARSARARLDERRELRRWKRARVMVLAGIGGEDDHDTMREALSQLLGARSVLETLTLLLTELSPIALRERALLHYDAPTIERLTTAQVVDLTGPNEHEEDRCRTDD